MEVRLSKTECTQVLDIAEHIVDIGAECYPVAYIKAQTTIDLANTTLAYVGFGIVVVGVDRIGYRDIVSHRAIRQYTGREGDVALIERQLERYILEVTVGPVTHP